jgi:ring-1,2-phenylacetyl-CoA epoxidase subunit PaaE
MVNRIPDPQEAVPTVAWPTMVLLVTSLIVWVGSSVAGIADVWPLPVSSVINAIAGYLLFTVSHDAAHHSASNHRDLNRWMGRISTPFFAPHASFSVWRFIHMQHHRFTNHDDGTDPDRYTHNGPRWQMPLRWLSIDFYYLVFYLRNWSKRPRKEKIGAIAQIAVLTAVLVTALATGHAAEVLFLYVIPSRIAIVYLAWAFDYLPHNQLHATPSEDKLRTTRNRIGSERLLSPMLLYQNYHLVHHLHPVIPFYRYIAVWRRNEEAYLQGNPALSTVRGRELTTDEYRQMRELTLHH